MGQQAKLEGPKAKFLWTWVGIIRYVRPKTITQENVTTFGSNEMNELLGDIYIIIRIVLNA
eukprot:8201006-Karenia_brevis.AAC.1